MKQTSFIKGSFIFKTFPIIHCRIFLIAFSFIIFTGGYAQYFYKDLLTLEQTQKKRDFFKQEKVHRVKIVSTDGEGVPLPGFQSEQEVNRDFSLVTTLTQTDLSGTSYNSTYFNREGRLERSTDSSNDVKTIIEYRYSEGRISNIKSITYASDNTMAIEEHKWTYNDQGIAVRMLLIKNERDTGMVDLVSDDKGMVLEEKITVKGKETREYFYYYDEKGRITDIVRFNNMLRRLLPDYIFEYDTEGRLGSMLMVPEDARTYQQWYYSYDEDGLKILDACYSKEKTLIAKLEYTYTYF